MNTFDDGVILTAIACLISGSIMCHAARLTDGRLKWADAIGVAIWVALSWWAMRGSDLRGVAALVAVLAYLAAFPIGIIIGRRLAARDAREHHSYPRPRLPY